MKTRLCCFSFLLGAVSAVAADSVPVEVRVRDIPANATQVVLLIDGATQRAAPNYEDLNPPPAAANAAAAANAQPNQVQQVVRQVTPADPAKAAAAAAAAPLSPEEVQQQQQQQRRRRMTMAAPALPSVREAVETKGSTTATLRASVPAGDGYQARVVALRGDETFPAVIAGGRIETLKVGAEAGAPLEVTLKAPSLQLDPATPKTVAPGARYKISGTITDGARALGTRSRMRVWISEGTAPTANYAGRQVTSVDVTPKGDDVAFNFELTAPKNPTTLYFQFGELPGDFARADNRQAPFIVLPDLSSGGSPLQIRVE